MNEYGWNYTSELAYGDFKLVFALPLSASSRLYAFYNLFSKIFMAMVVILSMRTTSLLVFLQGLPVPRWQRVLETESLFNVPSYWDCLVKMTESVIMFTL